MLKDDKTELNNFIRNLDILKTNYIIRFIKLQSIKDKERRRKLAEEYYNKMHSKMVDLSEQYYFADEEDEEDEEDEDE